MSNKRTVHNSGEAGFTLLEVLVALAILLIGLVSVLTMFPRSLSLADTANKKTIAAEEANQVMGEIGQQGADALYFEQIDPTRLMVDPALAPVGVVTTTQRMGASNSTSKLQRVTITVSFPNGSTESYSTYVVNP